MQINCSFIDGIKYACDYIVTELKECPEFFKVKSLTYDSLCCKMAQSLTCTHTNELNLRCV